EFSDDLSTDRTLFTLRRSPLIELAEPVFVRRINALPPITLPNDPLLDSQFYLKLTHTVDAWNIVRCDSTMVVASVDQGIEFTHPDLAQAVWHNPGEMDTDAHGNDKRSNGIDDDSDGFIDDWQGWDFSGADGNSQRNSPTSES